MALPKLLITRPLAEQARSADAAIQHGFEPVSAPLFTVVPIQAVEPERRPEALLFTSARAVEYLPAKWFPDLPVFTVGANTSAAVRAAGYRVEGEGDGDGSAAVAVATAAGYRKLLHISGADSAPLTFSPEISLERIAVYSAEPIEKLPLQASLALNSCDFFAVSLFSQRAAETFARLLDAEDIQRSSISLVTLSPAVADAAGRGWRLVEISARPSLEALMATAQKLWQDIANAGSIN